MTASTSRSLLRPLLLLLALLAVCAIVTVPSLQDGGVRAERNDAVRVELAPELLTVPPDGSVAVALDSGVEGIGFARVELVFEPQLVSLTSVGGEGPLLAVTSSTPAEANATGRIVIVRRAPMGELPSGWVPLATLHFRAATGLAEQHTTLAVDPAGTQIVTGAAVDVPVTASTTRIGLNPAPATCLGVITIPIEECAALRSFYTATAGDEWGNWFASADPCTQWTGVACSSGHVSALSLPSSGIGGTLHATLGDLPYLEELNLAGNNLGGPLPATLGALQNLRTLKLQANRLEGPIPTTVAALSALVDLDLGYNLLTAPSPQVADFLGVRDPDWARTQTVPPTGLDVVTATSTELNLIWQAVPASIPGSFYELYLAEAASGPFHFEARTSGTMIATHALAGLAPDTTYFVKLRTVSPAGDRQPRSLFSRFSDVLAGTTALAPPTTLRATHGTLAEQIHLTWDPVAGAGQYRLYRAPAGSPGQTLLATLGGTSYEDRSAADRTFYFYWVASCKEQLCGELSPQATGWRGVLPATYLPYIGARQ